MTEDFWSKIARENNIRDYHTVVKDNELITIEDPLVDIKFSVICYNVSPVTFQLVGKDFYSLGYNDIQKILTTFLFWCIVNENTGPHFFQIGPIVFELIVDITDSYIAITNATSETMDILEFQRLIEDVNTHFMCWLQD